LLHRNASIFTRCPAYREVRHLAKAGLVADSRRGRALALGMMELGGPERDVRLDHQAQPAPQLYWAMIT
jgi:hypothetical protein